MEQPDPVVQTCEERLAASETALRDARAAIVQQVAELQTARTLADTYMILVTEHNGNMDNECYNLRTQEICEDGSPLEPCAICPLRHSIKVPE